MAQQEEVVKDTQSDPLPPLEEIFVLTVTIQSAKNLPNKDVMGKSDPFCIVTANPKGKKQSWSTKVIENDLNPTWNEQTSFVFFERCQEIKFEVFDWDEGTKHDKCGHCTLDGDKYDYDGKDFEGDLPLKKTKGATLRIKVSGRSVKPLELEQRCEALDKELVAQKKEIDAKEAEKKELMAANAENMEKKKTLEGERDELQRKLDGVNERIEAQSEQNEQKQAEIERLKKEKDALDEKIENKKQQIETQRERLKTETAKLENAKQQLNELQAEEEDADENTEY